MKKTSKYVFYSPLTEKVLTECPCSFLLPTNTTLVLVCRDPHCARHSSDLHPDLLDGGCAVLLKLSGLNSDLMCHKLQRRLSKSTVVISVFGSFIYMNE